MDNLMELVKQLDEQIESHNSDKLKLREELDALDNFKNDLEEAKDSFHDMIQKQRKIVNLLFDLKNCRTSSVYAADTETKIDKRGKKENNILEHLMSAVEERRENCFLKIQECDSKINKKEYKRLEAVKEMMAE